MDLGNHAPAKGSHDGRSTAEIFADVRTKVVGRQTLLIGEWADIVAWANRNIVTSVVGAATLVEGAIDTGVPIAGDGAPLVSEFNLMEFIAVLGRNPDGGRAYVGRVIECAWRLPGIYSSVVAGRLEPWRAERIADLTRPLNAEAAAFVDRQLAAVGGVGWAQLERLVTEAVLRFDPELAEAEREAAADHRHFDFGEVDSHGQVEGHSLMDAADAHDLDQAVNRRAILRGKLGDKSSLDVRRAKSAGELARHDLALDLLIPETSEQAGRVAAEERGGVSRPRDPGRKVVLNVHITDTALTGDNSVGRWDEGRVPVAAAQIREWIQNTATTVIVRPVIDIADHVPVDSYEIPDRIRTRVELRDHTCRFPHCPVSTSSTTGRSCDLDHAQPHGQGGETCPCNLVPLCRRHHRAKTHSRWRYTIIRPGTYAWTSPHGLRFLVDASGTRALDHY